MTRQTAKSGHRKRMLRTDAPVVYRGVKIEPIVAKRSATARKVREALREAFTRTDIAG